MPGSYLAGTDRRMGWGKRLTFLAVAAATMIVVPEARAEVLRQSAPPQVIAHRGASAYLPEQTLPCLALAHAQGSDYIEIDVAPTSDGALMCLHDPYLETTTDITTRFPDRKRADGHWYALDFTLAEVKSLQVFGRAGVKEGEQVKGYQIATVEEAILLVRQLNARVGGRKVGLLIETKDPAFYRKEGKPIEAPVLALLTRYGFTGPDSGVILQSFDADHLRRLHREHGTRLPLMFLTSTLPTNESLEEIATWAIGVNPSRAALEKEGKLNAGADAFLRECRDKKLKVFVWTFNAEEDVMRRFLSYYKVDGIITNNPDKGVQMTGTSRK